VGSITFQVVGDASVGTKTKTFTVSDADVNRLVAWAQVKFATPSVAGALLAWANDLMDTSRQAVITYERGEALKTVEPPAFTAT
jgi:hypothetical protein